VPAAGNHRNSTSSKTMLPPEGAPRLSIPRDRHDRFNPALIAKYRRGFAVLDHTITALQARSLSTRDIQGNGH